MPATACTARSNAGLPRPIDPRRVVVCLLVAGLGLAACVPDDPSFSQYPGFDAYFAAHPRGAAPPTAAEQALLARYRPRLMLPAGHEGPIDFYRDYIAAGSLADRDGAVLSDRVTRSILNAHKHRPDVVFSHVAPGDPTAQPVAYGRIDRAGLGELPEPDGATEDLTFLTYHFVFRTSGLPAGLDGVRAAVLDAVSDLDDWHQLDHYTAASIVLDGAGRPFALMLQQHNYLRTYLIGRDVALPPDDRVVLDVAIRSNELYPHRPGRTRHRAVRFADADTLPYLMGFADAPFDAADDITDSVREAGYALAFLPPDDAFYAFAGFLGERRFLPGRDGPPGADYNTLPSLKPLGLQLLSGYWRAGNEEDLARLRHSFETTDDPAAFARAQAAAFAEDAGCAVRTMVC